MGIRFFFGNIALYLKWKEEDIFLDSTKKSHYFFFFMFRLETSIPSLIGWSDGLQKIKFNKLDFE